ncbi:MAG: DUF5696 domain-containing protein [Ruminococcus sp.]|nr:DUF5696 domain-containing protein [Ruminococcus sp.]
MNKKLKRILALILSLGLMCSTSVAAEDEQEAPAETEEIVSENVDDGIETDASEFETDIDYRTEAEVIDDMELMAENETAALYFDMKGSGYGPTLALVDKTNGANWFSSPINAMEEQSVFDEAGNIIAQYDKPKAAQLNQLKSIVEASYASPSARSEKTVNSYRDADVVMEKIDRGFKLTIPFLVDKDNDFYITIPVEYTLEEGFLKVSVDVPAIKEDYGDKILSKLSFMRTFGAAGVNDEGYFVVPDGSGALINFNNGKTIVPQYSGTVYGTDITKVPITATNMTQNASLPMYGIVKNGAGIMAVVDKGDAQCSVNAYISGLNNKVYYNACFFDFLMRGKDDFTINGTENDSYALTVYEQYGIKIPKIEVRYYPVSDNAGTVDFVDIATSYRNYLKTAKGAGSEDIKDAATPLYLNFYGGTIKQESILGIPVKLPYAVTKFDTAKDVLERISAQGVSNIVATYEDYTQADIKNQVASKGTPSGILGGKGDFNKLLSYADSAGIEVYPSVSNIGFVTGGGFNTVTDTAIRITGQFSRQTVFDLAHKIPNQYYDELSLLSPLAYSRIYKNLTASYPKLGYKGIALGETANTLYGDYGRSHSGREESKATIIAGYEGFRNAGLKVLADNANGFVIPYADHITNIPLESSGFDIFDRDIPFYQIAMFGLVPVSTVAANSEARMGNAILESVSAGANLSFDMIGVSADDVKDTRYDNLYYAEAERWVTVSAKAWEFQNKILGDLAGTTIVGYDITEQGRPGGATAHGKVITTTFSNGTVLVTDLANRTITKNGTVHSLYDYIGKEVIG